MPDTYNSKYTAAQIESFFDLLNSNSFITNTVSNLVNYYLKSDTYSKSEVDSIINTVKNGRFQNVNSLPEQDIDTNVIYLVQKQDTENNNIKDEYINLDGTSSGWEKIGSTEINLDGYVTIQALNTALSNYVQSSNIVTILANRTSFSSVADMIATPAADLYDGCLAYVTATKKNYQYDSTNEADPTLGKWRELQTGGGGGTDYTAGDGIDITEDVISTEKSQEGDIDEIIDTLPPVKGNLVSIVNAFNRGDIYSTDEKMIGQWTDGKPIYQKTISCGALPNNNSKSVAHGISNISKVIRVNGYSFRTSDSTLMPIPFVTGNGTTQVGVIITGTNIIIDVSSDRSAFTETYVTLQYTKTTDTAISIGEETEYSTDEKVVGTWIDGKPVYQRSYIVQNQVDISENTWNTILSSVGFISVLIDVNINGTKILNPFAFRKNNSDIQCYPVNVGEHIYPNDVITIQYTKSTT